jgi:hypothetical protein
LNGGRQSMAEKNGKLFFEKMAVLAATFVVDPG